MVYILSCIIDKFFFPGRIGAVDQHLHLALFRADDNRLVPQPADHVKRVPRLAPQSQLQGVFFYSLFQGLFELVGDLEEPVGRTQPPDTLMGPLVVVIFHPEADPVGRVLEAGKLRALQKLPQDRLPEALDLAQGHRVVRAGLDVFDPVFLKLALKPGGAAPVGVLAAVVGEHLLGNTVFGDSPAVGFDYVLGGLAAVKTQPRNVSRVVVDKPDQVGVSASQPEGHDVALPHLVGRGSFEKPGLFRVLLGLGFFLRDEPLAGKGSLNAAGAGGNHKPAFQDIGDPARPEAGVALSDCHDSVSDVVRHLARPRLCRLVVKPLFALLPKGLAPAVYRRLADIKLLGEQEGRVAVFDVQPCHPKPKLEGVRRDLAPPLCTFALWGFLGTHRAHSFSI
jgi:hypothetical protein